MAQVSGFGRAGPLGAGPGWRRIVASLALLALISSLVTFFGIVTSKQADASSTRASWSAPDLLGGGNSDLITVSCPPSIFCVTVGTTVATPHPSISVAAGVVVTGKNFSATEGQGFSGTVASFTDSDGGPMSDYSATVDWGDGSTNAATLAGSAGSYSVVGYHTYAEGGSFTARVSVTDSDGASGAGTASATVAEAAVSATGASISATVGSAWSGTVATFSDADTAESYSDYGAAVIWGDGTTSAATLAGSAGSYSVISYHTFSSPGSQTATVYVYDDGTTVATPHPSISVAAGVVGLINQQSSSAELNGQVTASDGPVTAVGAGSGTVTVGQYSSDPVGAAAFGSSGAYMDVSVSAPNTFSGLTFKYCDLNGGTSLQWWDPAGAGAWVTVSNQRFNGGPPACVVATVGPATSPTLAQLTGTVFTVSASTNTPGLPNTGGPPSAPTGGGLPVAPIAFAAIVGAALVASRVWMRRRP